LLVFAGARARQVLKQIWQIKMYKVTRMFELSDMCAIIHIK